MNVSFSLPSLVCTFIHVLLLLPSFNPLPPLLLMLIHTFCPSSSSRSLILEQPAKFFPFQLNSIFSLFSIISDYLQRQVHYYFFRYTTLEWGSKTGTEKIRRDARC